MRSVLIEDGSKIKINPERRNQLKSWLQLSHKAALSNRFQVENEWRNALRAYEGGPYGDLQMWRPFEGAEVVEVTEGASACDTVLSQAQDLIFQVEPPLTIRSRKADFDDTADAVQDLVNWGIDSGTWKFEPSVIAGLVDTIQLGPQVHYTPWTKTVRKGLSRKVTTFGPKIYCIAPEDFIIPSNAMDKDVQEMEFCTVRFPDWSIEKAELAARLNNWNIDDAATADNNSIVRHQRLRNEGLVDDNASRSKPRICVALTYCYFDIDGDGEDEDLKVIWNMTSGAIWKCMLNDELRRPFNLEAYQDRAHTPYGMGVMKMSANYQRLETTLVNNHNWNLQISNTKMYQMPEVMMNESEEIYPGKRFAVDDGEIRAIDMGEVNNAAIQFEAVIAAKLKERIGVQNLSAPIRSSSRTPGISMLSMIQQANRRFTHPFNNMRNQAAGVVMQCIYRYQERVLDDDQNVIEKLGDILGPDKAALVIRLFERKDVELTDALDIQLTASSVSVNRESDRQNMVMLTTQVIPLYWQAKQQLAQWIAMPPFQGADAIAKQADQVLDRIFAKVLRTFDQISDVRAYRISLQELEPMAQGLDQMYAQVMGQADQGNPVMPNQSSGGRPAPSAAAGPKMPPPSGLLQ